MTDYHLALEIDFGEVGYRNSKQRFRVRLDSAPLAELIRATLDAHRVYELLLIDRPGDVWDYVWVVLGEMPKLVAHRVKRAREKAQPARKDDPHPWPEDRIPFKGFDDLCDWIGDDTEPEDSAWLSHRDSALMKGFAQQALAVAREAQSSLDWNDPLRRHIVDSVRSVSHPYCLLDRDVARSKGREYKPNEAQHTPGFYDKLGELLQDANLASVAYRADGDWQVLRMMATEQRRRAHLTGHSSGNALHSSALVNHKISNEAWDSEIWLFDEGLAHGDLYIQGHGLDDSRVKWLFESGHRDPCRFILSTRGEGPIEGYEAESGESWVLYRRQTPDTRRRALEMIEHRRHSKLGAVLSFAPSGATLFDYDKTMLVVGDEVPTGARAVLAEVVAEWQRVAPDLTFLVLGDTGPFDLAGCKNLMVVPAHRGDENSQARWLAVELRRLRPWTDAVIALQAPGWVTQTLAGRLQRRQGPWATWVVATKGEAQLKIDLSLDGDLEQLLIDAQRRARSMRPRGS